MLRHVVYRTAKKGAVVVAVRRPPRHPQVVRGRGRRNLSTSAAAAAAVRFQDDTTVLLCSNIPVEPTVSAAGVRTTFLLERLVESPGVTSVHLAAPRKANDGKIHHETTRKADDWKHQKGVHLHELSPNQSQQARDLLLHKLPATEHLLVIFDRFYAEEMYSHFVHNHCPHAVLVLDMQDMHALRGHRRNWVQQKQQQQIATNNDDSLAILPSLDSVPGVDDPNLLRELASIHRSDLTLVCSSAELELLTQTYQIPNHKLCLAPLFGGDFSEQQPHRAFGERCDFVFVGGFRHEPNVDAVRQLKRLWPRIRKEISKRNDASYSVPVKVHVYGAYCTDQLRSELHDPKTGFLMHGYSPLPVDNLLADKRVLLSPLRFGAGIKGKHVDAWKNGLPVVTTPIGSEGMMGTNGDHPQQWGGLVASNDDEFIRAASTLYKDETKWNKCVSAAPQLLSNLCGTDVWNQVAVCLVEALENRQLRRNSDFNRSLLWHQSTRSTEYFSKFIEWKEKYQRLAK